MGRKTAREDAFKLIFEYGFRPESLAEILAFYYDNNQVSEKDKEYIDDIVNGVSENLPLIDAEISKYAKGWRIERIAKVSLAVLRLCIYEMLKREDIPVSVSISEALKLVEKYEGAEAKPFVNGILGSIDKTIERDPNTLVQGEEDNIGE